MVLWCIVLDSNVHWLFVILMCLLCVNVLIVGHLPINHELTSVVVGCILAANRPLAEVFVFTQTKIQNHGFCFGL